MQKPRQVHVLSFIGIPSSVLSSFLFLRTRCTSLARSRLRHKTALGQARSRTCRKRGCSALQCTFSTRKDEQNEITLIKELRRWSQIGIWVRPLPDRLCLRRSLASRVDRPSLSRKDPDNPPRVCSLPLPLHLSRWEQQCC